MDWDKLTSKAPKNSINLTTTPSGKTNLTIDVAAFLGVDAVDKFDTTVLEFLMRLREYASQVAADLNATADTEKRKKITAYPDISYGTVRGDYIEATASVQALIPVSPLLKSTQAKPRLAS